MEGKINLANTLSSINDPITKNNNVNTEFQNTGWHNAHKLLKWKEMPLTDMS